MPSRHCSRGASSITVSTIESGAGSVARVGAADLAEDPGDLRELDASSRSMRWSTSAASVIDMPGGAVGM